MTVQHLEALTILQVPQVNSSIITTTDESLTIRAEADRQSPVSTLL
jgi:hypothetical protein